MEITRKYELVYQLFPRSFGINDEINAVINCFAKNYEQTQSPKHDLSSDGVLKIIANDLKAIGFNVEEGKQRMKKYTYLFYLA